MGDESLPGERASETDLSSLTHRVASVEDDLDEKITDLRERVVQLKRESDAKAPADHTHDELAAEVEQSLAAVSKLREHVADFDDRTEQGFENYERVLTTLRDDVDDVDEKLTRLAGIVVDLRSRVSALESHVGGDEALEELRLMANRRGVRTAACAACGETVDVALLTEPRCPLCDAAFDEVEPKRGLFGSARLTVEEPPALKSDAPPGRLGDDESGFHFDEPRTGPNEVADGYDSSGGSPKIDD